MFEHGDIFIGRAWKPAEAPGRLYVVNPAPEEVWQPYPTAAALTSTQQ